MIKNVYFIGIGGIGMSALARYFMHEGMGVAGYDLTETPLTRALSAEGASVHYEDSVGAIPLEFRDPATTLVVFTPAVPADHSELSWFLDSGFMVEKRSEMLGHVAEGKFTMAVAGTHGKTTTTTLVAWLNSQVAGEGSAFLGGISKNFDSNLVLGKGDRLAVEADEFDRSFLRLSPDVAVVTSVDADHLDIYGTHDAVREAFSQFVDRIRAGGAAILNSRVDIEVRNPRIETYSYSLDDPAADFHAENLRPLAGGYYEYDIVTPDGRIADCRLGITGRINVENSVAAVAMMWAAAKMRGETLDPEKLREGLATFTGVRRRFDIRVESPAATYIDDYAHHPRELEAALGSIREMLPDRRITAIFQPHLYTRTRDFHAEFADALSKADELILTPIYPAREEPIEGVDAEMIGRLVTSIPWSVVPKERLAEVIAKRPTDVVVTFGAGNIENHCEEIAAAVKQKINA
ncbi:MAG: UDP-N-acetylmuramate--L-alanine ligase [Alistipes sp.]|jgi:UDP-N-acetylmuramate--alanine ligase|nr:UDP-N-acetylmuramate--L-alanine ligase [Alistipes sp.]